METEKTEKQTTIAVHHQGTLSRQYIQAIPMLKDRRLNFTGLSGVINRKYNNISALQYLGIECGDKYLIINPGHTDLEIQLTSKEQYESDYEKYDVVAEFIITTNYKAEFTFDY